MKIFKGKSIYKPAGKAGEYAEWACNFHVGCSGGCDYCYLKKGRGAKILGGAVPVLKKCFRDEEHAMEIFRKELNQNLAELQQHGLFFSFSTDPMLHETMELTMEAVAHAQYNNVLCKILTKQVGWVDAVIEDDIEYNDHRKDLIAYGFTLTGHDDLEPGSASNAERISAMEKLHNAGFKTWASLEPIIGVYSSLNMINATSGFCDLYKVGLLSGGKYTKHELVALLHACSMIRARFYFKNSFIKQAGLNREDLPENCVSRDYNIFNE